MCKDGTMWLEKITTQEQTADVMTKGLQKAPFTKHRNAMLGIEGTDDEPESGDKDVGAEQQAFDKLYGDTTVYPKIDEQIYEQKMQDENLVWRRHGIAGAS